MERKWAIKNGKKVIEKFEGRERPIFTSVFIVPEYLLLPCNLLLSHQQLKRDCKF